jgi:NADH-quinone oxidoreductase subunit E
MLQDIQAEHNYLPQEKLRALAERLDLPLSRIYGVATFYKTFSLEPKGKHIVHVCLGTACHVRGAPRILEGISRQINLAPDTTAKDLSFTLETVNCLGSCALGPLVVVDKVYHAKATTNKMNKLLEKLTKSEE